jgi:hypothetical protein
MMIIKWLASAWGPEALLISPESGIAGAVLSPSNWNEFQKCNKSSHLAAGTCHRGLSPHRLDECGDSAELECPDL